MKLNLRGLLGRLKPRKPDPVDAALERARRLAGPRPVEAQFPPQPTVLVRLPGYVPEEPWGELEPQRRSTPTRRAQGVPDYTPRGDRYPHVGVDAYPTVVSGWAPPMGGSEDRGDGPAPGPCGGGYSAGGPDTPAPDSGPVGSPPAGSAPGSCGAGE